VLDFTAIYVIQFASICRSLELVHLFCSWKYYIFNKVFCTFSA